MGTDLIKEILILNPDIKIILMIRNPIKRTWSHVKNDILNKIDPQNISDLGFKTIIESEYQMACSNYSQIISNWSLQLKKGNLFIGFFDDITKRPEILMSNIISFLNVDKTNEALSKETLSKIINKGPLIKLTRKKEQILKNMFQEELEKIEKRFNRKLLY